MQITYHLTFDDIIEHQSYTAAHSTVVKKKMLRNRYMISLMYLIMGIYFIVQNKIPYIGVLILIVGIAWFYFYPSYSIKRYFKFLTAYVKENYAERIGEDVELEIDDKNLKWEDSSGGGEVEKTKITSIIDLKSTFVLKLESDASIVIPKKFITDSHSFLQLVKVDGVEVIDAKNWTWK